MPSVNPQAIAATLTRNTSLQELDLSWNNIRQESAAAIGRALCPNRGLEYLSLAHNAFSDAGSQEVGDSLRTNTTLKVQHDKIQVDVECERYQASSRHDPHGRTFNLVSFKIPIIYVARAVEID